MKVTWLDRLKTHLYLAHTRAHVNRRHPVNHKDMTHAVRYGLDREIHKPDVYVSRTVANRTKWTDTPVRTMGGWRHGQQTPPRPTEQPR